MSSRGISMRACGAVALVCLAACGGGGGGGGDDTADDDGADRPDAGAPDSGGGDTDPPTSSASPTGGTFFTIPVVTISADEPATIYYTVDGTAPTSSSPSGPAPLTVPKVTSGLPLRFYAVDAAGNAESPAHAESYQTDRAATISISLATQTVTVTDPPTGLTLSGTAVYNDTNNTVAVTLSVVNLEPRLLYHLKAMFGAVGQGTVTADGRLDGAAFTYFGPQALDAAAAKTAAPFTLANIDGTVDPVTVALTFRTDPTWIFNGDWDTGPMIVDSSNSGMSTEGNTTPFGYRGAAGDNQARAAVLSPDGRLVYMGMRNNPKIVVKDLTTLDATVGATLDTGIGAVTWLALSPDGATLYALLLTGDHAISSAGKAAGCRGQITNSTTCAHSAPDLALVALRRSDLVEVARVSLVTDSTNQRGMRGRNFAISADGTRAAVPIMGLGRVAIVDLGAMDVLQMVDITSHFDDPHSAAFSADGSQIFVSERDGTADLLAIDAATYALSEKVPPTAGLGHGVVGALTRGPDGRIYWPRDVNPQLVIYDPETDSWDQVSTGFFVNAIAFPSLSRYALLDSADRVEVRLLSNDSTVTLNPDRASSALGHGNFGHVFLVGPD